MHASSFAGKPLSPLQSTQSTSSLNHFKYTASYKPPHWQIMGVPKLGDEVFSEQAMRRNTSIIDYCRTSGAAIAGATAGILGLTGLYGFGFFIVYSIVLSTMLAAKAGTNWSDYFRSRRDVWFSGVLGGLFTYVLLWTFLYGMVHVY